MRSRLKTASPTAAEVIDEATAAPPLLRVLTSGGQPNNLITTVIFYLRVFRLELLTEHFCSKGPPAHILGNGDPMDLGPFPGLVGLQADDTWVQCACRPNGGLPAL